jgi:hypothetical protein
MQFTVIFSRIITKKFGNSGTKNNKNVLILETDTVLTCFNIIVISVITKNT